MIGFGSFRPVTQPLRPLHGAGSLAPLADCCSLRGNGGKRILLGQEAKSTGANRT